jgi:hypothetical protein
MNPDQSPLVSDILQAYRATAERDAANMQTFAVKVLEAHSSKRGMVESIARRA